MEWRGRGTYRRREPLVLLEKSVGGWDQIDTSALPRLFACPGRNQSVSLRGGLCRLALQEEKIFDALEWLVAMCCHVFPR